MVAADRSGPDRPVDPWDFGVGGIINADYAPPEQQPFVAAAACNLYLTHLAEAERDPKKAARMFRAIAHLADRQDASLQAAGCLPDGATLRSPAGQLRRAVHRRLPERICLALLVSALINPPFAPYQLPVRERQKDMALARVADDLGLPRSWIPDALRGVNASRSALKLRSRPAEAGLVTYAGVNPDFAFLARPVAAFFAPEGPACTESLLAGLAAVGETTGTLGGVLVITAAAAVPQEGALARALVTGTTQEIEGRVLLLHATALAKRGIRPGTRSVTELRVLRAMLAQLGSQLAHREAVDVRAGGKRELEAKLKIVQRAAGTLQPQPGTGRQ